MENVSQKIEELQQEIKRLEAPLADPAVLRNPARLREAGQTYQAARDFLALLERYQKARADFFEAQKIQSEGDDDLRRLADDEVRQLEEKISALEKEIRQALRPRDPLDEKAALMEIRAGTGGDEAALFAAELLRMYSRYAERRGWPLRVLSSSQNALGGMKEVIVAVEGRGSYGRLKKEAGVHRVQRIPDTEKSGRVHTSTASVAVFPEIEEGEFHLDPKDVKIETSTSSGHGGQSVNTTYSAIRLTHIPTGLIVSCQDQRSQQQNRARALQILRGRLWALDQEKKAGEQRAKRREQIGSAERAEKIRTYNFSQDRLTDHRLEKNYHRLSALLDGDLDALFDDLESDVNIRPVAK